ncbi:hypothetical protein CH063_09543 [Colletotrichum higginsianum]|uniref:Uncharacterized protein n=1 Tax=Colletotrichum higginsianum (strain IMI 349063) TaxID=759273 RepID=H1VE05_COLHI|nr:hypothetical protein CH63R_03893 [Colletotrichum higginsianum IMI 349063]OBR11597.1 hypothetical protein CH63R_03893 [Colletotrichum higginsianum IMI 349063]GJC93253.1 hypothetical protein ColKHC_02079 [Colletotrichum higginsianum]CCF38458.1 hypothetical protein CH063_09543 [Colletotrichum higginsianum]
MAHQEPRALTEAELRRYKDCADENAKLAECWASHQVVIIACEPSDSYKYAGERNSRAVAIHVMSPAEKPVWGQSRRPRQRQQQPSRQLYQTTIRFLERSKENKSSQPRPWHTKMGSHEVFEMYSFDAREKARETFDELGAAYVTVCIVSYDVRETTRAMDGFGVRMPAGAVLVDLVKVLEHQTRDEGIPEELSEYTNENIAVRNGRYDRRPGTPTGPLGMPSVRLLEVLGPAAAGHRADFKRTKKGSAALKRIASRIRNG